MTSARLRRGHLQIRIGSAARRSCWRSRAARPPSARNPLKLPDTQYEPIAWADDRRLGRRRSQRRLRDISEKLQGDPAGPPVARRPADARRAVQGLPEGGGSASRRSPARRAPSSSRTSARCASRRSARPMASSPATTSRSSRASQARRDGYDFPLYRKPSNLLPGGRMAIAGAPVAAKARQEKEARSQAPAGVLLRPRRDRRRRAGRARSGDLLAEGSDRIRSSSTSRARCACCSTTAS